MRTLDCEEEQDLLSGCQMVAVPVDRYRRLLDCERGSRHGTKTLIGALEVIEELEAKILWLESTRDDNEELRELRATVNYLLPALEAASEANRRVRELAEYWRSQGATSLPNMLIATLEGKEVDQW